MLIDVGAGFRSHNMTKLADIILKLCGGSANQNGVGVIERVIYSRMEGGKDELVLVCGSFSEGVPQEVPEESVDARPREGYFWTH